jgi:DNA-binding CsgD family transcriptional regulator
MGNPSLLAAPSGGGDSLIDRFGDETVTVVCRALGAEWGSFYRIGSGQRPFGFRTHGVPWEFGAAYVRQEMQHVDPLHPFRLVPRKQRFQTMGDTRADNPSRHRAFLSFLHSYGAQDAAEMIFCHRGKAVAGLSIAWTGRRPEHHSTVTLGSTLHAYIEFNLSTVWPDLGLQGGEMRGGAALAFTSREKEVIDVICRGFTNEQIASHLNISIATVKTHLIHIFKKAGVETRGELISRMLSAPHAWAATAQPTG